MRGFGRSLVGGWLLVLLAAAVVAGSQLPAAPERIFTRAAQETFLLNARVVKTRTAAKGITNTVRATLSDGTLTHDASIQTIDTFDKEFALRSGTELNFRDSWQFNVAAYELDKLLQLDMIPTTVARKYNTKPGSFTWWVDDVAMDEEGRMKGKKVPPDLQSWNQQLAIVRVFDQLIDNTDRNLGNLLISSTWRVWMIDHSRGFTPNARLRLEKNLTRVDRQVLDRIKQLDEAMLKKTLGDYVDATRIKGLLERRDLIVTHFSQAGEPALFDWQRR